MDEQHGEHVDSLIDAYALGALDAEEMARVEDHIEGCASCRALLATARAAADALLYAAPPAAPPPQLRAKLLARVHALAEEERRGIAPAMRAQPAQTAAREGLLARLLGRGRASGQALGENDETLEELAALLANPESLVWEVGGTAEAPGARGQFVGIPGGREAVLVTAGLAPLPPGKAYQVWLLRGGQPVPNALFRVGRRGEGRLVVRSATQLRDMDTVAVTPEPATGSPAPTGPIVLAGQLA